MDLSKCTELVNGLQILLGPDMDPLDECWPWQCVVKIGNSFEVLNFDDRGVEDGTWGPDYSFKLPEPEWMYGCFFKAITGTLYFELCVRGDATHRYQAGKPETMEKIDE